MVARLRPTRVPSSIRIYGLWLWPASLCVSCSPHYHVSVATEQAVCLATRPDRWEGKRRKILRPARRIREDKVKERERRKGGDKKSWETRGEGEEEGNWGAKRGGLRIAVAMFLFLPPLFSVWVTRSSSGTGWDHRRVSTRPSACLFICLTTGSHCRPVSFSSCASFIRTDCPSVWLPDSFSLIISEKQSSHFLPPQS